MPSSQFVTAIYEFVILIFSLSVHESAHAWMASRLGDQTARMQGRISLNPAVHVDPIGTLLFPAIAIFGPLFGLGFGAYMIGWAKPVMINTRNFKKIVRDDNLVSIAGPASNLLLALLAFVAVAGAVAYNHSQPMGFAGVGPMSTITQIGILAVYINLSLFFFNLLPVPPLDGSHVMRNLLPYNAAMAYDRIGGIVSYMLILFVGGRFVSLMMAPTVYMMSQILMHV